MRRREEGATIVEFALVFPVFLTFLLAVLEFSRLLYTWNAANEATREGARYAVVCADPTNSENIKKRMQIILPDISNIQVLWEPAGCDAATCEAVTVSLTDMQYTWITPIAGVATRPYISMPSFSTYLQREMMTYNPEICNPTSRVL